MNIKLEKRVMLMHRLPSRFVRADRARSSGLALCMAIALAGALAWSTSAYAARPRTPSKARDNSKKTGPAGSAQRPTSGFKALGAPSATNIPPSTGDAERKAVGPRPVITCDEPIQDFGEVWVGPVLSHTFKITNTGEAQLKITKVKPSCGCTIAGSYPRTLNPGESGDFPFSVSSKKLRGKFAKGITISTNDPATPNLRLQLRGQVKRYVDVAPTNIQLGKLYGTEPRERVIKLTNNTENPLELTIGESLKEGFDVKLKEIKPGQEYELLVTARPPFTSTGVFKKKITLNTNLSEQKTITIDVRGTVPQRIDVKPSALTFSQQQLNRGASRPSTRVVRLTNYGVTPVKVLEATVDDPALTVTVKEQKEGEAYNIQIKFPAGYKVPDGGRMLTLKTNDDEKPTITVPIKSIVRSAAKRRRPAQQLVGKPVPNFTIKTLDGKTLSTDGMKGNVTVLDFFAVNCGFCKKQIPRLETVRSKYADKGVRFIAFSQSMRNKRFTDEQVMKKINDMGFKGEVVTDPDNTVGPLFKATSYPTMVVIGKTGKVDAVNIGNVSDLETRLSGQLDALIAGKPIPANLTASAKKTPTKTPPKRKTAKELVGKKAPDFEATTFDGKAVGTKQFAKNAATILNFVASNCGFCKKQVPRLESLRKKYEAKGVRFINVVETMRKPFTKEEVISTFKKTGTNMEMVHDPKNQIGPKFNASSFPTMVVVGKTGNIEAVNVGNIGDLETRLTKQLDAIIAGKPVPKLAAAPSKPRTPQKSVGDLIGKPAPSFATETLEGKKLGNAEFAKSAATVLNFFATNCGYCKKQIPRLEKIRQKYADKGVRFVNVSQKMRTAFATDKIVAKMKDLGFQGELAIDHTNKIGGLFNARGFPTMVVVGKTGNVEAVNVGNMADLEKRMDAQLTALIDGKPIPKFAGSAPAKRSSRRPAEGLKGKPAPPFALTTLKGASFTNADFAKHKATILDFVAPNCGFCKRQIPGVEKLRQEYESKGVRFITVAQKMRKDFTDEEIVSVFKKAGSNMEMSTSDFAENKIGKAYKAVSFPTMFVIDKNGKINEVIVGAKKNLDALVRASLDALLKG